jgi:urease accessory protein
MRKLDIDVAADASVTAVEGVILGRAAMGETLASARFRDSWRIRRAGKLVLAEETACDGGWERAFAAKAALGEGASAFATVLQVAPDAAGRLDLLRAALDSHAIDAGASVVDGVLVARMVATDSLALRRALVDAIRIVTDQAPPRVWAT